MFIVSSSLVIVPRATALVADLGHTVVIMSSSASAVVVMVGVSMDAIFAVPVVSVRALPLDLVEAVLSGLTDCVRVLH
jgi:hypothetical protein